MLTIRCRARVGTSIHTPLALNVCRTMARGSPSYCLSTTLPHVPSASLQLTYYDHNCLTIPAPDNDASYQEVCSGLCHRQVREDYDLLTPLAIESPNACIQEGQKKDPHFVCHSTHLSQLYSPFGVQGIPRLIVCSGCVKSRSRTCAYLNFSRSLVYINTSTKLLGGDNHCLVSQTGQSCVLLLPIASDCRCTNSFKHVYAFVRRQRQHRRPHRAEPVSRC